MGNLNIIILVVLVAYIMMSQGHVQNGMVLNTVNGGLSGSAVGSAVVFAADALELIAAPELMVPAVVGSAAIGAVVGALDL